MVFELLYVVPTLILAAVLISVVYGFKKGSVSIVGISLIAVIVVIIGGVLVPIISDSGASSPPRIVYDDYFETDAQSATGALELIEIGGTKYAHAISVGSGELIYSENTVHITVYKADLDVFLLDGQSNIAYIAQYADLSEAWPVPSLGEAYYFGTNTSAYCSGIDLEDCTIQSFLDSEGHAKIGRFECAFSAEYTNLSGHKVLTVNAAIGGKSINSFQPGQDMNSRAIESFETALGQIDQDSYNVRIAGLIWCQGEADTTMTVSEYKTKFLTWWSSLKSNFPELKDCYINLIKPTRGLNSRTAQLELANSYPEIKIACSASKDFSVTNGCMIDETATLGYVIHYSQLGENICGKTVAQYIA